MVVFVIGLEVSVGSCCLVAGSCLASCDERVFKCMYQVCEALCVFSEFYFRVDEFIFLRCDWLSFCVDRRAYM